MKLRIFTANTVAEAMRQIRQVLGDEAVIISTQSDDNGGVRVTAALEADNAASALDTLLADDAEETAREGIRRALDFHRAPPALASALIDSIGKFLSNDPTAGLEAGLRRSFDFAPIDLADLRRPLLLLGIPGAGKTVTAAKLATRAVMNKRPVTVISADGFRAGAREELAAFTNILETGLVRADGPGELRAALAEVPAGSLALIDTTGTNPFDAAEMTALAHLVEAAKAEPVLVAAAGGDTVEAAEIAAGFAAIGARRIVVTRLDISRRFGAMLVAAESGPLAFSDVSFSPQVARGLKPLTPQALARLLMRDPRQAAGGCASERS